MLREGERVRKGDFVDICNDGYKDDPVWVKVLDSDADSGGVAPDPL